MNSRPLFRRRLLFWLAAIPVLLIVLVIAPACTARPEAGEIGVVRNGGPFDNRAIREILHPGVGTSWIGWASSAHFYPAAFVQRYYAITADAGRGDRPGVDVVSVQTADGFQVGLEGTFYFKTAFDGTPEGDRLLEAFDNQFGTRRFPVPGSGELRYPWEGDNGWSAFLDAVFRPVIDNELRQAVAQFRCEELIASCSLVATRGRVAAVSRTAGRLTNLNLQKVQEQIVRGVQEDMTRALGGRYFREIKFRLVRVTLPEEVQRAINDAQAAFAAIARARAQVQQAEQQRQAALKLASLYARSPQLAQIEMVRELAKLPQGTNVYFGIQPVVGAPAGGR